ncbi:MAG: ComEA family DNA-binding protein [Frankiales bacterium]|nr:ComEA family DNA-binding protein [Frankiales bacterium]
MPIDDSDTSVSERLSGLGLAPPRRAFVPEQPFFATADDGPAAGDLTQLRRAETAPADDGARPVVPPSLVGGGWAAVADRLPPWLRGAQAAPAARAVLGLAAVCLACVVVTGWTLLQHRGAPARVVAPLPLSPLPAATAPTPTPAGIVVDVGGRVRRPGLVTLPLGSRVADALRAAGGALRSRDLATVNLAAVVTDGQLLLIGVPGAAVAASGGTAGSSGPVELNTATAEQLDALPGVGPVLAQRILDWRAAHGGFHSPSDLKQVPGIGDAIFAEISPLVRV